MRWPFVVAYSIAVAALLAVWACAILADSQSRLPDPWLAMLPALALADICAVFLSVRLSTLLPAPAQSAALIECAWRQYLRACPRTMFIFLMGFAPLFGILVIFSLAPGESPRAVFLFSFGFLLSLFGMVLMRQLLRLAVLLTPARHGVQLILTPRGRLRVIQPLRYDIAMLGLILVTALAVCQTRFALGALAWLTVELAAQMLLIVHGTLRYSAEPHSSPAGD